MIVALQKHIRSNVVGYIALFLFAVSGTAQALPGLNKVDSGDIKNHQVTVKDLAVNSVGSRNVIDGSLGTADLGPAVLQGIAGPIGPKGEVGPQGPLGPVGPPGEAAKLTAGSVATGSLADGSVTTPKLANGSVTAPKLATSSVTAPAIATGAVASAGILDESIGSQDLATDSVGATEIADDTIDSGEIVDNSLGAIDLAPASTANSELAGNAVDSSKVLNNSLTAADLSGAEVNGSVSLSGVSNGRCNNVTINVSGAVAGEIPLLATEGTMQEGILFYAQRVASAGHVTAAICNFSGGPMEAISGLPIHVITIN